MEEGKQFLAATAKQYLNDPSREAVDEIITQLAQLYAHKHLAPAAIPATLTLPRYRRRVDAVASPAAAPQFHLPAPVVTSNSARHPRSLRLPCSSSGARCLLNLTRRRS